MARGRGGYGVRYTRARGGFPLLAAAGSLLGGLLKKGVKKLVSSAVRQAPAVATGVGIAKLASPVLPPTGMVPTPGMRGKVQRILPGGESGFYRRRRMNVANPKALRRAIRRTDGFVKLAKRTLKGTGYTVARRGLSKAARTRKR
jgi:hypothetical protein